jgi:hypothetical protein
MPQNQPPYSGTPAQPYTPGTPYKGVVVPPVTQGGGGGVTPHGGVVLPPVYQGQGGQTGHPGVYVPPAVSQPGASTSHRGVYIPTQRGGGGPVQGLPNGVGSPPSKFNWGHQDN